MRKTHFVAVVAAGVLALAAPAYAINDGRVPADECSGNENAVGTPGGGANPGLDTAEPVGPPASANNPGNSQGARGEERSHAPCNA